MWLKLTPFWAGPSALIFFYYAIYMHRNARPLASKIFFFLAALAVGAIAYYYFVDPTFKQIIELVQGK